MIHLENLVLVATPAALVCPIGLYKEAAVSCRFRNVQSTDLLGDVRTQRAQVPQFESRCQIGVSTKAEDQ